MPVNGALYRHIFFSPVMNQIGKYVITGGPGSGKTTLLDSLRQNGYHCSAEVSRRMIMQQVELGSDCLPWLDVACFSLKVLDEMINEWANVPVEQVTFFDRGIPDVIAYLKLAGLSNDKLYYEQLKAHPYQRTVFILPPWQEIYVNDPERWQSYEESVTIYQMIRETYIHGGYQLIEVPLIPVGQRVQFVLRHIK
jgi:predicted ATPase